MPKKAAIVQKAASSVDDELTNHLQQAEDHLIAAVELFTKRKSPDRTGDYIQRLTKAQETVTLLLREELVRIRGPLKMKITMPKKR